MRPLPPSHLFSGTMRPHFEIVRTVPAGLVPETWSSVATLPGSELSPVHHGCCRVVAKGRFSAHRGTVVLVLCEGDRRVEGSCPRIGGSRDELVSRAPHPSRSRLVEQTAFSIDLEGIAGSRRRAQGINPGHVRWNRDQVCDRRRVPPCVVGAHGSPDDDARNGQVHVYSFPVQCP